MLSTVTSADTGSTPEVTSDTLSKSRLSSSRVTTSSGNLVISCASISGPVINVTLLISEVRISISDWIVIADTSSTDSSSSGVGVAGSSTILISSLTLSTTSIVTTLLSTSINLVTGSTTAAATVATSPPPGITLVSSTVVVSRDTDRTVSVTGSTASISIIIDVDSGSARVSTASNS